MNFRRKVLLATCGLAVVALPVAFALAYTAQNGPASQSEATAAAGPRFEVASIKLYASDPAGWRLGHTIADPPNEGTFEATEITVERLVEMAFGVHDSWLIQGGPSWFRSEKFDIQAKAGSAANQELSGLSKDQASALKHRMLQALLTDRLKLAVHRETQALPGYALVIAKSGPETSGSQRNRRRRRPMGQQCTGPAFVSTDAHGEAGGVFVRHVGLHRGGSHRPQGQL